MDINEGERRNIVDERDVYLKIGEITEEEEEGALKTAALKESQSVNIMGIQQQKGSSNQSSSVPSSPSDVENRPPVPSAPNSDEVFKEDCVVITSEEYKDHVAFASEIVHNLIDELHIENDGDLELPGVNLSSGSHSLCSLDLSPSETSFNTAKEEVGEEEEDRELLVSSLEKTDTEFESVDEDGRSDSDSFSYNQCKTVITVRSCNVLVDAGHDHLCGPIPCDLSNDQESTLDRSVVEGSDKSATVEYGFPSDDTNDILLNGSEPSVCEIQSVLSVPSLEEELHETRVESDQTLESTLTERVESEPVPIVSSEESLPKSGFEQSFVSKESELVAESNGSDTSSVAVFDQPTILSCNVPNVDRSESDVKETELVSDNLTETSSDRSRIQTTPLNSEEFEVVSHSETQNYLNLESLKDNLEDSLIIKDSETDSQFEVTESIVQVQEEPDLNVSTVENAHEGSRIVEYLETSLLSELIESVDRVQEEPGSELELNVPTDDKVLEGSLIINEPETLSLSDVNESTVVLEDLCSEPKLNVTGEVEALVGSRLSSDPTVIVQFEVEEPTFTPEALAEDFSKLNLNSEFVESDLPIGDSSITDEQNTESADSLLNGTFPSVSSISKGSSVCSVQSDCDLIVNNQTENLNVENNNSDETLKLDTTFEAQSNGNGEANESKIQVVVLSPSTKIIESVREDGSIENTFICPSQLFGSTVDDLDDVDFEQILKTESSHIVEELFNLSQHSNELEVENQRSFEPMPTAETQQSEDVIADAENNEALSVDVNINPFENRSRLTSSPQRCLSTVDNKGTIENNDQKMETNFVASKDSPKRRNPSDVERCSVSVHSSDSPKNDDANEESSDVFKVPAKVTSSPTPDTDDGPTQQCLMESSMSEDSGIDVPPSSRPRSSASTAVEDCSGMTQSVEGRSAVNFSEAGPDVAECKHEEFRSATDFFMDPSSLDFLEKCDSGKFAESALSRMSLYMKFDPLVPGNSPMSRRLTMWLKQQQDAANRDTKTATELSGSPSKSSDTTIEFDGQKLIDLEASPLKLTVGSSDSQSVTNTSRSSVELMPQQDDGKKLCDEEVRQMLKIQELLFQDRQLMKDREWDDKLKAIEMEKQQLSAQVQSLRESQHQMRQIVGEYEKTISQLISDKEHDKQMMTESASQITKERDQALEDLQSVETAFADLHRRYEKAKTAVEGFKKNEDTLKGCVNDLQTKLKRQMEKYELLRNRAEERLESANVQIENMGKANESEVAALRAQLKKSEMMVSGLENTLEQKVKENAELTNICDELIAQVGHKT